MTFTLVSFHAHPDDEALLTGGSLARAAAEGHRVVVVVATSGEAGLTDDEHAGQKLGETRLRELAAAGRALGCARVECLGYADSGSAAVGGPGTFSRADPEEAARRLAAVLADEAADALTIYDPAGGYGHPDHVAVHVVGRRAAELAGTALVLEATVDRSALLRVVRLLGRLPGMPADVSAARFRSAYTARDRLTHRVDVRGHTAAKRAALAAHASQAAGGDSARTIAMLLRLPNPVFRRALGHEWFVEHGRPGGGPLLDDIFASLRGREENAHRPRA
jgi:LmbE family N-acetylglucosaminyl deacetylase